MKKETIIWIIILAIAVIALIIRAGFTETGMGKTYVKKVDMQFARVDVLEPLREGESQQKWVQIGTAEALSYDIPDDPSLIADENYKAWTKHEFASYTDYVQAKQADPQQDTYQLSWPRTIGLWIGAFFTLAIFSFLYKDNPFYKIAESSVVGVSAAYWMVAGFWDMIVPNLLGPLSPGLVQGTFLPGDTSQFTWQSFTLSLIALVLGIMLLWRLAPKGGWIARWPMAFIIGVFCGWRLIRFMHGDFLAQIRNSIKPILAMGDGSIHWPDSIRNAILIIGVLACLVYFFFSIEHRGFVGRTAKVGIWFLMVTFGAAFGYTVMGRIALLAIRLEFLFDDWLWLIDPTNSRQVASLVLGPFGFA